MKRIIVLAMLMMVSSISMAQGIGQTRAAIQVNDRICRVGYFYDGQEYLLESNTQARVQWASGSAGELIPGGYSNAILTCRGEHEVPLEETDMLKGGFCFFDGVPSDDFMLVINKGGKWMAKCNFPRYNPDKVELP